jgi:hypothetical protein
LSDTGSILSRVQGNSNAPSVVAPCRHCDVETVWLRTMYGGWLLFDAVEQHSEESFAGNRYAVDRRTRLVVDLDNVRESRWPRRCLRLHKFRCPRSYDDARYHKRRPRQTNEIDLTDLFGRLAAKERERRAAG